MKYFVVNLFVFCLFQSSYGLKTFKIDDVLNANGVFGDEGIIFPTFGMNSFQISAQASQLFSSMLSVPTALDSVYTKYAAQYGKQDTDDAHKDVFKGNLLSIFKHNMEARAGRKSFEMGVNKFSDMTRDEVIAKYTGALVPNTTTSRSVFSPGMPPVHPGTINNHNRQTRAAPDSRDWRSYSGVVGPPKNQQSCGSCTMFALTGALESSMALYKGVGNLDLSEQELLDCATGNGIARCKGNSPDPVYDYQKSNGQGYERDYKYENKEGSCRANGKARGGKLTNYYKVNSGDENMLKEYVGTYGPCSVIIQVDDGFYKYKRGVYSTPCDNTRWDHSVLVVGYGNENGKDHWIVKNSWDTNWGDKGYIKMQRNARSLCRIADYAILPQAN